MNRKVLGSAQSSFVSKLPARSGTKIPAPTPNKGILKGTKRDAEEMKENAATVAITEPPAKKVITRAFSFILIRY